MTAAVSPIQSFTNLDAWKIAHAFVLHLYEVTKLFPREEQFALTNQMRRAAVSITSNIAEGFSRKSRNEKQQFYRIALSSLTEIQNQLFIARDIHYISKALFSELTQESIRIHKLLNGLIKSAPNAHTKYELRNT